MDEPPAASKAEALLRLVQATPAHVPDQEANHTGEHAGAPPGASQSAVAGFLPALDFANHEEEDTTPLIGNPDDMLLPQAGMLIMYGDGGAGKTTLTLDAMCHLASGTTWLGQPVPTPLRILLIENEGPRGMMAKRLKARITDWEGDPWHPHVQVWFEPWGRFSFREEWCRQAVADEVTTFEANLIMVGPLAAIGALGGGTPDEVNEFWALMLDTQARTAQPFASWVIHHENKAGDVSGAWERLPDTLVHVSGQGNGHTRVHWRKARWSSLHDTSMNLTWTGTYSFEVDDPKPTDDDRLTQVRELFEGDDQWRNVKEVQVALGMGQTTARRALDDLTTSGVLAELVGPPGRNVNARCWRLAANAPAVTEQSTLGNSEGTSDPGLPEVTQTPAGTGDPELTGSPSSPKGNRGGSGGYPPRDTVGHPDPDQDSTTTDDPDHDIPF